MKRILFLIITLLCLSTVMSFSQNIAPDWTAIYQNSGDNSDRFNKVIPDGAGNFIAVGYTIKPGNYRDFLTVKFNSSGDTLWWRTKNGKANGEDEAIGVGVDALGYVYVTGYSDAGFTQNDILTVKYDANGLQVWDTLWNSPASLDDVPVELVVDINGNIIIGGNAEPDTVRGSNDMITLKYNPSGGVIWSMQYSNPVVLNGKDELAGVTIGLDGDIYVTGRSFTGTSDDFVTIKYDQIIGTQKWIRSYDAGNNDRARDIVADHAGYVIVTGQSGNGNNYDFRTIKYDSTGIFVWTRLYNAPINQDDIPICMAVDANDNVIITGESDSDPQVATNMNFLTVKYNSAGALQWQKNTSNVAQQDDHPNSIAVDAGGNIFVTGKSDQHNAPLISDDDFMTMMYDAAGNIQWGGVPIYYAGSRSGDDDIASCVIVDGGVIYVVGGAENTTTQKDATVVKYDVATGNMIWDRNYNGEGDFNESAKSIVVDFNNNSYAAGYSFMEKNNLDATITKVDPGGNILATYRYKGIKGDDDEFEDIAVSTSGNIYAAGYTKVIDQKRNLLLVRWNPVTFDTVWTRTYDYIGQSDRAESLVLDAQGNIYVTGRSDANAVDTTDNMDIITLKFDANGDLQWNQRYAGGANMRDEPVKILLDNNGDVLVGGLTENVHDDDFFVIKYNASTGAPVWGTPITYGGPFSNDDRVTDIAVDAANNIFIAGYSQTGSGDASQDPVVLKYDAAGVFQAGNFTIGDAKDEAVKITVDINNNVYVLFKYDADGGIQLQSNYDFVLRKFPNNLDSVIFVKQYDSPVNGDDLPADMIINPAGDIYITGSSENDTSGGRVNKNWVTLGYDDSGAQIFYSNYDGPNATDDSPNAMIIRGTVLWVCGYTEGSGNNQKDKTINNYNLFFVGIDEFESSSYAKAYPNPFNDGCTIYLKNNDAHSQATLEVYDVLGNLVAMPQIFTGNSVQFSRGNLTSGVYEYRINSKTSLLAHGKMIIN